MRSFTFVLVLIAVSTLVIACNQQADHAVVEEEHEHVITHSDSLTVRLNDGERWVVNDEMKPFVADAEAAIEEYSSSDEADHKVLAARLGELNMGLIQSCTMKGESHDELHKWLAPHMDAITSLEQTEDTEDAKLLVVKLKKSFETYHRYFQ
jgi:hypothetical protein